MTTAAPNHSTTPEDPVPLEISRWAEWTTLPFAQSADSTTEVGGLSVIFLLLLLSGGMTGVLNRAPWPYWAIWRALPLTLAILAMVSSMRRE
jgi:hypothetical protein